MKLITLVCPYCNATLEVKDGLDTFYCMYCGNKVMLEGLSKTAYHSKTKVKEMEHNERLFDKLNEQERFKLIMEDEEKKRNDKFLNRFFIGSALFFILMLFFLGGVPYVVHRKNVKQLMKIESEVNKAISSSEYDNALLWANQLYLDDDWSRTEEETWNTKRENYISFILDQKRKIESDSADYILVPDDSDKFIGKKYSTVVTEFESAGFTNVKAKASLKNAGFFDKNETVEHITISGISSFTKEETFNKDSTVVIYYYQK